MDDEFDQLWSVESGLAGNGQYEAFAADMEGPESQLAVTRCIGQRPGAAGQTKVAVERSAAALVQVGQIG